MAFFSLYKFGRSFVYFDQTRGPIWSNFRYTSRNLIFFANPNRIFSWMGKSCKLNHFSEQWIFETRYCPWMTIYQGNKRVRIHRCVLKYIAMMTTEIDGHVVFRRILKIVHVRPQNSQSNV